MDNWFHSAFSWGCFSFFKNNEALLVTIFITRVAPLFWFRKYHVEHRQYLQNSKQYKVEQERLNNPLLVENINVNENIRRYVETQNIKTQNTKW